MTDRVPEHLVEGLSPQQREQAQEAFAERMAVCVIDGELTEERAAQVACDEVRVRARNWRK